MNQHIHIPMSLHIYRLMYLQIIILSIYKYTYTFIGWSDYKIFYDLMNSYTEN